jgi:hypothetical protein
MRDYFKPQLEFYSQITEDVLERAEFKTVWSGKRLQVGDKVIYALVYVPNTDDLKAISFVERELDEIGNMFNFLRFENETIPVLSFKNDTKNRD